jgi:hypothetical protein
VGRVVTLAVEGPTDAVAAKRLLDEAGLEAGPAYVKIGKGPLDKSLNGYNNAARISCWLVLRDLDRDADCAPEIRRQLLPTPAPHMRLHLAVRALEAWLIADAEAITEALSISAVRVPPDPEAIADPKRMLVDLARNSRSKAIRRALVPAAGTTASVGPGYTAFLTEFISQDWRPEVAAARSQSLARLRTFLRRDSSEGDPSS